MKSLIAILALTFGFACADEHSFSEKGKELFANDFSSSETKGWNSQFGEWKISDGVLRARQVAADNHAAAARQVLATQDAIYSLRFRLVDKCRGFHFGFDPKRGTLKKKGHLFSVIVTPAMAKLMKHVDKNNREGDPNEDLDKQAHKFEAGKWYQMIVEKNGNNVLAKIQAEGAEESIALKASHPTFHVPAPTLVFRCIGDGVEVDDVKVWGLAK